MKSTLLIPLAPSLCHAPTPTTGFLVVESIRGHHQALKDIERSESSLRIVVNAMTTMEHIVLLFVETFGKTQNTILPLLWHFLFEFKHHILATLSLMTPVSLWIMIQVFLPV
jgi:hypothetical protein